MGVFDGDDDDEKRVVVLPPKRLLEHQVYPRDQTKRQPREEDKDEEDEKAMPLKLFCARSMRRMEEEKEEATENESG